MCDAAVTVVEEHCLFVIGGSVVEAADPLLTNVFQERPSNKVWIHDDRKGKWTQVRVKDNMIIVVVLDDTVWCPVSRVLLCLPRPNVVISLRPSAACWRASPAGRPTPSTTSSISAAALSRSDLHKTTKILRYYLYDLAYCKIQNMIFNRRVFK